MRVAQGVTRFALEKVANIKCRTSLNILKVGHVSHTYKHTYIKFIYRRKQSYNFTIIANIVRLIKKIYLNKSTRSN